MLLRRLENVPARAMTSALGVPGHGHPRARRVLAWSTSNGIRTESSVPLPGRDSMRRVPPIALIRSCMAISPSPLRLAPLLTFTFSHPPPSPPLPHHLPPPPLTP